MNTLNVIVKKNISSKRIKVGWQKWVSISKGNIKMSFALVRQNSENLQVLKAGFSCTNFGKLRYELPQKHSIDHHNISISKSEYLQFLSLERLSGRNDVTTDKVNVRRDIKTFFWKKIMTSWVFVARKTIWSYLTLINIKLSKAHAHQNPTEPQKILKNN